MTKWREEIIGDCRLILGDCRFILPTIGKVDAVVTDPPYGQNINTNVEGAKGAKYRTGFRGGASVVDANARLRASGGKLHSTRLAVRHPEGIVGDGEPFDPNHLISLAPEVLIWGAHKFAHSLPEGSWLVWDKVPTGKMRDQGDGEAAWINRKQPLRIFRLLWDGVCVGSAARSEVTAGQSRVHPTQKPLALMAWCLDFIKGNIVLDPYMGSGSTGVAAIRAGRKFIGIEIEKHYFDIACHRIEEAYKQPDMFIEAEKPKAEQVSMAFDQAEVSP